MVNVVGVPAVIPAGAAILVELLSSESLNSSEIPTNFTTMSSPSPASIDVISAEVVTVN